MIAKAVGVCFLACLTLSAAAWPEEVTYRRITMKERLAEFYREGGRNYLGKKVHILVDASVFRRDPEKVKDERGRAWLRFTNKSVPLLVSPGNLYFKRLGGKLAWQKQRLKLLSVYGKVVRPPFDLKGRCHIVVYKIKAYGGSLKKIAGLPHPPGIRRTGGTGRETFPPGGRASGRA